MPTPVRRGLVVISLLCLKEKMGWASMPRLPLPRSMEDRFHHLILTLMVLLLSLTWITFMIGFFISSLIWITAQHMFGESLSKASTHMIQTTWHQEKKWTINSIIPLCSFFKPQCHHKNFLICGHSLVPRMLGSTSFLFTREAQAFNDPTLRLYLMRPMSS